MRVRAPPENGPQPQRTPGMKLRPGGRGTRMGPCAVYKEKKTKLSGIKEHGSMVTAPCACECSRGQLRLTDNGACQTPDESRCGRCSRTK